MDEFCGTLPSIAQANPWWQPHGHCVRWNPWIVWSWTISDVVIWACYLAIPVILIRNLWGTRSALILPWMAPFILACGFGHLWDAMTIWKPWYALMTVGKLTTATVSVLSVIGLAFAGPTIRRQIAMHEEISYRIVEVSESE